MLSIVGARTSSSMKILASRIQFPEQLRKVNQALGDQVAHVFLTLPHSVHAQQGGAHHLLALLFDQTWP